MRPSLLTSPLPPTREAAAADPDLQADPPHHWFLAVGWFYLPCSLAGSLATLFAVAFLITVFRAADLNSASASDTIYRAFPYFVCTFLLFDWLARRASRPANPKPAADPDPGRNRDS